MLEKWSKMIAREAMADLVGWTPGHGELPRFFEAVAKSAKLSYRTARSLWTGEIDDPDHWAVERVRREAVVAKAQREARNLAGRFETIARGLHATDQDFYSSDVATLVSAARILRGLDRSGNSGADR